MTDDRQPTADTATPKQVAEALYTTEAGLAQMRFRGTGPKFCKVGRRVLYAVPAFAVDRPYAAKKIVGLAA